MIRSSWASICASDANGNVLSLVDASAAPTADNRTWGVDPLLPTLYDGLDRLKQVKSANQWGLASYSYDPLDNLRTNQLGATTLTYSYDAGNKLSSLTNGLGSYWSISTDTRGNITANALKAQAYQFDLAHRMNAVTGKESYLYDGHGRRARSLNLQTGKIEYYGYGKDGRLLQDWSDRRGVRNGYIYLGNTLVGLHEVNFSNGLGTVTPKYQHTDALGSPVVTTNASKTVLSRMSYTPYGLPTLPMDGVGYTGHFMDVGTQLTYMQQRYYDPQMGRFLSEDPVTPVSDPVGAFNRYKYAANNPFRFIDPDGRYEEDVHHDLTAVLAQAAGAPATIAAQIAGGNQGVDDNPATSPMGMRPFGEAVRVRAAYHFTSEGRRNQLYQDFKKSGSPSAMGVFLHAYQDSFSHEGYGARFGHLSDRHAPDKTFNDVAKADRMARNTYNIILNSRSSFQVGGQSVSFSKALPWKTIAPLVHTFNSATTAADKQAALEKLQAMFR